MVQLLKQKTKAKILAAIVVIILLILAPLAIKGYWMHLLTEIVILSLFATSLNLIMGYGGMISFGHAGFFGLGLYISAGMLKYGMPLPVSLLTGAIAASVAGVLIGLFCVRLRAFYFAILTLAFGQLIWAVTFKWYAVTGGEDGIVGINLPVWLSNPTNLYLLIMAIAVVCIVAIYWIVNSPFGRLLSAIRENSERTESIGINVNRHRFVAFVISTFFAGIAGGLHCLLAKAAFPDLVEWSKSGEVLLTCVLGGMYTFVGPMVGAVLMVMLHSMVAVFFVERWPLVLGAIFVLVALFIPQGIVGLIEEKFTAYFKRRGSAK
jgi:branched-chain amino acid transport system permease protein